MKVLTKVFKLMYIGTYIARIHLSSYIAWLVNSVLWFIFIFTPVMMLSEDVVKAFQTFVPGLLVMSCGGVAISATVEFLRWNVNQGITDTFRENGLNVFAYLLTGVHIDVIVHGLLSYTLLALGLSNYLNIGLPEVLPKNPVLFTIAIIALIPTYLLIGSITAYVYTVSRVSSAWMLIVQMLIAVGTVIPPNILTSSYLFLVNPLTIVAELARASYGQNVFELDTLLQLSIIALPLYVVVAYFISIKSDKYISRRGLEYRF